MFPSVTYHGYATVCHRVGLWYRKKHAAGFRLSCGVIIATKMPELYESKLIIAFLFNLGRVWASPTLVCSIAIFHDILLLGECRTLWGEREQAKHCGIEMLCT